MVTRDVPTRIACDVDFEREGRHVSFLAVANSTNESAYGTVTIPITVLKNGRGPTIFLSGGLHGDEYEGPVALMKLARRLEPEAIQGRVIIVPCLNLPAVMAGERLSPVDRLNLNRVFPGRAEGSITETIAHYVARVLLPMTDVQVDLHSGGRTLDYIPSIIMNESRNTKREKQTFAALKAFGAPIGLVNQNLDTTGLLETLCERMDILNLNAELGGAGMVRREVVEIAETGVLNILRHFEVMDGDVVQPEVMGRAPTRLVRIPDTGHYVMAPDDGIYEPFIELGDMVEEGQAIGQVHYPHHGEKEPWVVHAPVSGFLLCKRPPGKVQRGDNVAIFAIDLEGGRLGRGPVRRKGGKRKAGTRKKAG